MHEHDFYQWLKTVNWTARQRYYSGDIAGLTDVLRRLQAAQNLAREEPLLSTLETSTASCILVLAEAHLDCLHFEECLALCASTRSILEQKAARYRALGRKPRPDSTNWSLIAGLLGDAKWKGPPEIKNAVASIAEMIRIYHRAERNVRRGLRRRRYDPKQVAELGYALAWCGTQVIRAATRHAPTRARALRRLHASYHGPILDDPSHPCHWELRITELFLSCQASAQDYAHCYARRRAAFIETSGEDLDLRAYDRSARNELAYLLRQPCPQPARVVRSTDTRPDR